jgi:dihydroorotase
MSLLLKNGSVVSADGVVVADVATSGGLVTEIGAGLDGGQFDEVIDVEQYLVGPGFVDLHVHLREPGQEWKEDIATGSAAAAAGGFTTVVAMPNTDPAIDAGHLARYVTDRGNQAGLCRVMPSGCITMGRQGAKLAHLDDLRSAGVHIFTDDGDTVSDAGVLRRAMMYIAEIGGIVAQHCEDSGLARGGHMHEGSVSSELGITGLPSLAEELVVARDLKLVELTGCRYHVQHVSSAGTVKLIRQAKAGGLPVTCEVAPHHVSLDHSLVETMDGVAKMYPPLRTPDDIAALTEALIDGTIDAVATDHAPHSDVEKDVPFEEAPRGITGLETSASVINGVGLDPVSFFERMSVAPGALTGAELGWLTVGAAADIVVFDPEAAWTPVSFKSKSSNSPWVGKELRGKVKMTLLGGTVTHQEMS